MPGDPRRSRCDRRDAAAFDFRHEHARIARLDDDAIEARAPCLIELLDVRIASGGNERHVCGRGMLTKPPRRLEARDTRQFQIHHNYVWPHRQRQIERGEPIVGGRDVIAERPQIEPPHLERVGIVVNEENSRGSHEIYDGDEEAFLVHRCRGLQVACQGL